MKVKELVKLLEKMEYDDDTELDVVRLVETNNRACYRAYEIDDIVNEKDHDGGNTITIELKR